MSNIVQFPLARGDNQGSFRHVGARLLNHPPTHAHAVQFYDNDAFLFETVALFLRAGLAAGDAALVIATPAHTEGILAQLGAETRDHALDSGQLVLVDAEAMLARFMLGDSPDEALLLDIIDRLAKRLGSTLKPGGRIRAFGEMVDLLVCLGKPAAATELEDLWNRVLTRHDFALLCGYGMYNFYKSADTPHFGEVCRLHTHVMPTERFAREDGDDFERLRYITQLEQRARLLGSEIEYREELESLLEQALAERVRAEADLRASSDPKEAGGRSRRSYAPLKDLLYRLLDPLETLLESARLLAQPLGAGSDRQKLERLANTGARLSRMIEQILKLARSELDPEFLVPVGETRSPRRVSPTGEEVPNAEMPIWPGSTLHSTAQRGRDEPGRD